jgi:hypothetical protein
VKIWHLFAVELEESLPCKYGIVTLLCFKGMLKKEILKVVNSKYPFVFLMLMSRHRSTDGELSESFVPYFQLLCVQEDLYTYHCTVAASTHNCPIIN